MPVDRTRYPSNWRKVSLTIRRLAGWRCEWCQIENGAPLPSGRAGKVVLTVAHLGTPYADGTPGNKQDKHDIRRENLAALCQACHLRYDLDEHIQYARETRYRKKIEAFQIAGQLSLFPDLPLFACTVCKLDVHLRRFAMQVCHFLKPPVERVAGFAGLFPLDPGKNTRYVDAHRNRYSMDLPSGGEA
jgi:hypothetical protein